MNVDKIKNIDELILLPKGKKIVGHNIKRLTAPGENYGSLMLSVDVIAESSNGTEEIHTVAKMVPPNEFIQQLFNTQVTFRNEIEFYKNMVPLLRDFQKAHGVEKVIDFFPEYYGSRLNLNNDDNTPVDVDGALILENLKIANFANLDRLVGFDLDVARLVIIDLAYLHAVPLALKLENPDVFEKQIKPYLNVWKVNEQMYESMTQQLKELIDITDEIKPLSERILKAFAKFRILREAREPWATITHNDCWVNNTMVKLEEGKPVKNKIVDFQVCDYGSPAKDVLFFLYSSVKNSVIEEHYDELIKLYYETFIGILKELHCDTTIFSFESFLKELDFEAEHTQFSHLVFMITPIFAPPGAVKEIDQLDMEAMPQKPTKLHQEKMSFVVKEFVKRKWI